MMAIIYDFNPDQIDPTTAILRRRLGREPAQYLAKLQDEIGKEFEELGKPAEFAIDIDYREPINQHDFQAVVKAHNVKNERHFSYRASVPGCPQQYSKALIEWLLQRYEQDEGFIAEARERVRSGKKPREQIVADSGTLMRPQHNLLR